MDNVQDHRRCSRVRAVWSGARSGPVNKLGPRVLGFRKSLDFFYIIYFCVYACFSPIRHHSFKSLPSKRVGRRRTNGRPDSWGANGRGSIGNPRSYLRRRRVRSALRKRPRRWRPRPRRGRWSACLAGPWPTFRDGWQETARCCETHDGSGGVDASRLHRRWDAGRQQDDVDDDTASEPSAHVSGDQLPAGSAATPQPPPPPTTTSAPPTPRPLPT